MTENTASTDNVTDIQDAADARWLGRMLAPARAQNADGPTAEAIDRIRMRVMGEPARGKRTLAA